MLSYLHIVHHDLTVLRKDEGSPEPIEWPPSPSAGTSMELDATMVDVAS